MNLFWAAGLILSGIAPKERLTWLLEVFPVLVAGPLLLYTDKRFEFPAYIHCWIFVHGLVLMLGGHYTYAEVPLGYWVQDWFDLSRNHYDRLGHLMQGWVPALVAREILARIAGLQHKGWLFFLTVTTCMAISVTYEFIEWGAALILGQNADSFLGTQGDQWDTQWDMFLATIGALAVQWVHPWRERKPPDK